LLPSQGEVMIGFIGAGKVGTALAVLLSKQGYQVSAVSSRSISSAENLASLVESCKAYPTNQQIADAAEIIFITTPDDAIGVVASEVNWHKGQSVVHCSGAASTDIIEAAKKQGAQTGCIHPLQSLADLNAAIENIPGSTFAIEAEEPLLTTLKEFGEKLQGTCIELKASDKIAYHAAAVMACNYLVTMTKLATDLWQNFNVPRDTATKALLPLIKGSVNNIEKIGIPACLTGPIARGDIGTISNHLTALEGISSEVYGIYRQLGLQTVPVALEKGTITPEQANNMTNLLINDFNHNEEKHPCE